MGNVCRQQNALETLKEISKEIDSQKFPKIEFILQENVCLQNDLSQHKRDLSEEKKLTETLQEKLSFWKTCGDKNDIHKLLIQKNNLEKQKNAFQIEIDKLQKELSLKNTKQRNLLNTFRKENALIKEKEKTVSKELEKVKRDFGIEKFNLEEKMKSLESEKKMFMILNQSLLNQNKELKRENQFLQILMKELKLEKEKLIHQNRNLTFKNLELKNDLNKGNEKRKFNICKQKNIQSDSEVITIIQDDENGSKLKSDECGNDSVISITSQFFNEERKYISFLKKIKIFFINPIKENGTLAPKEVEEILLLLLSIINAHLSFADTLEICLYRRAYSNLKKHVQEFMKCFFKYSDYLKSIEKNFEYFMNRTKKSKKFKFYVKNVKIKLKTENPLFVVFERLERYKKLLENFNDSITVDDNEGNVHYKNTIQIIDLLIMQVENVKQFTKNYTDFKKICKKMKVNMKDLKENFLQTCVVMRLRSKEKKMVKCKIFSFKSFIFCSVFQKSRYSISLNNIGMKKTFQIPLGKETKMDLNDSSLKVSLCSKGVKKRNFIFLNKEEYFKFISTIQTLCK